MRTRTRPISDAAGAVRPLHKVPAANHRAGADRWTKVAIAAFVMMIAMRPIANVDLWWILSHGRAVVDGCLAPSQHLLAGDSLAEAPWLQGVPFTLLYLFGGVFPLMVFKLVAVTSGAAWCWKHSAGLPDSFRLVATTSFVVATHSALGPTAPLWDALGLLAAMHRLSRMRTELDLSAATKFGLLACLWSNLGSLSILVFLPLAMAALSSDEDPRCATSRKRWLLIAGAALLGSCLTPRGPFTLWDSLRQLAPWLVEPQAVLDQTSWRPLWDLPPDGLVVAWSLLTLLTLAGMLLSPSASRGAWLLFALVQCLGVRSYPSAVVLSVWLSVRTIEVWRQVPQTWPQWFAHASVINVTRFVCLSLGGMAAWGMEPFSESRTGWGLSRQLEVRELAAAIGTTTHRGTAHCTDVLAAGMLAWSEVPNIKPFLVPHRALLNGTLRDEVLLTRELETGWLQRHQRSDGTLGGWWLTLQSRQTVLVVTAADRAALILGLESTLWKPLSLDSPVIPYAMAGDREFSPRIVQVLNQRELVDRGAWSYQAEPPAGNDRLLDAIGVVTGALDSRTLARQARVLRAMNLPQAAMRVLRPSLSSATSTMPFTMLDSAVRRELVACQVELADREWLTCGAIDEFRSAVVDRLIASDRRRLPPMPAVEKTTLADAVVSRRRTAVELYLQGNPLAAAELLVGDDPSMMCARAALLWEAGVPEQAFEVWTALTVQFPASRFALVGRHALDSSNY